MSKINGDTKEHPEQIDAFFRRLEIKQGPSDPRDSILPPRATILIPATPIAPQLDNLEEYERLMGYRE